MSETQTLQIRCPSCGGSQVAAEFDHDARGNVDMAWWNCRKCGHCWRFQDEKLNPENVLAPERTAGPDGGQWRQV